MERDQKKLELKDVLLPTHVKPSKYFVEITPHFESFSFNGFETIEIEGTAAVFTHPHLFFSLLANVD